MWSLRYDALAATATLEALAISEPDNEDIWAVMETKWWHMDDDAPLCIWVVMRNYSTLHYV